MHLDTVAVHPDAQGRGLGGHLVGWVEKTALRAGLCEVRLYTHARMRANVAWYPRLGYRIHARRQTFGFARIYFRKPLRDRRSKRSKRGEFCEDCRDLTGLTAEMCPSHRILFTLRTLRFVNASDRDLWGKARV